ncbi:hypothetical protein BZM27_21155 [Paraburkholderia steynii]|uniref:Uncharacterized protein n=1 Tax=Paraburkholderia steynii TaxID=1245441 RepID=A0A4V2NH27_9BURK|nr:hypothetical protein BZM27_21155 [Paraburkholderia steynii]
MLIFRHSTLLHSAFHTSDIAVEFSNHRLHMLIGQGVVPMEFVKDERELERIRTYRIPLEKTGSLFHVRFVAALRIDALDSKRVPDAVLTEHVVLPRAGRQAPSPPCQRR